MHTLLFLLFNSHNKYKKFTIRLSYLLFTLSIIEPIYAQDQRDNTIKEEVKHQISLRHDNDFLAFSDIYYTSGLFLSYNRLLNRGVLKSGQEQISMALVQQIYTPSKLNTTNLAEIDRPYAGYMELNLGWSYVHDNYSLRNGFYFRTHR